VQNRGIVVPTAMTEPADQELIDLLVAREGIWTEVELFDGKTLRVLNIAWGYDQGAIAEREERERGWSARLRRSHPNWWSVGGAAIVAVVFVARALADESDMAMPAGELTWIAPTVFGVTFGVLRIVAAIRNRHRRTPAPRRGR
jgi:hypothetical protein